MIYWIRPVPFAKIKSFFLSTKFSNSECREKIFFFAESRGNSPRVKFSNHYFKSGTETRIGRTKSGTKKRKPIDFRYSL